MGGKRPDQYNIDPAEAGSTDYKSRREGRSGDEHLANDEKAKLASNPHDQPMIPESVPNPALRELRERKGQGEAGAESAQADGAESEE